jgi:hypothetical protein
MFQTSNIRNNEIINLNLSIGQSKLLAMLVSAELSSAEAGTSSFEENALKTLLEVFMAKTQETEAERKVRFQNWVGSLQLVEANHG